MNDAKTRLARWLENNPDSWLKQSYVSIAKESGVSATSVDRYLPELIADRDEIMPSEVLRQREEAGLSHPGGVKVDRAKIRQIIKENPNTHIRDIAYLAKCHPRIARKVREEMEEELEESQSISNEDEARRDTQTEMAKLEAEFEARRAALLKN
jgi:hypothetical protein